VVVLTDVLCPLCGWKRKSVSLLRFEPVGICNADKLLSAVITGCCYAVVAMAEGMEYLLMKRDGDACFVHGWSSEHRMRLEDRSYFWVIKFKDMESRRKMLTHNFQ
jgi:hypothetical protein